MMDEQQEKSPSLIRKERRLARRKREEVRKLRFSNKTSEDCTVEVSGMKTTITFEDLDEYQLYTYRGIHSWWDSGAKTHLVLSGYAGAGKTSLLNLAIPSLVNADGSKVNVVYTAYTGKAASVLISKGLDAQTLHSLIYDVIPASPSSPELTFVLKDPEDISAEIIIVDEASMVPDKMREDLESLGIPLLYCGDNAQLPPIAGHSNVMEHPDFNLEKVHRQALDSGIIQVATDIREGRRVVNGTYGKKGDAIKVGKAKATDIKFLAEHDMVICYTNATRHKLNAKMREFKGFHGKYPNVGEQLVCVRNNKNTKMINGLILTVKAIREEGGYLVFDAIDEVGDNYYGLKSYTNYFEWDDHPKIYGRTLFDVFEFAYCLTCHKCQGSQWGSVCVIEEVMRGQSVDMKRRWLYTACTRAVSRLTWISRHN